MPKPYLALSILVLSLFLLLNSSPAWSKSFLTSQDLKTNEQLVEAEGQYTLKKNDSKSQALKKATENAKTKVLGQIANDYLASYSQDQLTKKEIISITSEIVKFKRVVSKRLTIQGKKQVFQVKAQFSLDPDKLQQKTVEKITNKSLSPNQEEKDFVIYEKKFDY